MSEVDVAKYAGEVLRKLIKKNNLSQEEFAFGFGTDVRNVSRWINEGITKIATLQELSNHFKVSIKDFLPD